MFYDNKSRCVTAYLKKVYKNFNKRKETIKKFLTKALSFASWR